ncbi:hypothetical protein BCR44DRAFT_1446605 [Catenaria anguillulae PL171]|uniref:Uncharacterized protein n=1 Tax=Catenaria anguillulae PL171 TaxID=765915 RepID=A0A1Y2H670_9FUNG|nr:hypothetical protein BCR44DRAFT_1446605 [Catenaria anguillulae PL171]
MNGSLVAAHFHMALHASTASTLPTSVESKDESQPIIESKAAKLRQPTSRVLVSSSTTSCTSSWRRKMNLPMTARRLSDDKGQAEEKEQIHRGKF